MAEESSNKHITTVDDMKQTAANKNRKPIRKYGPRKDLILSLKR